MKALLTGSTGFLGSAIETHFKEAGFSIDTLNRSGGTFQHDLSISPIKLEKTYDLVVHNAGKAHLVPKTEEEKRAFFQVNEVGTANLLASLDAFPRAVVLVSTVAVYGLENGENISESHDLNPETPYGLSKLAAERLVVQWCEERNVAYYILRLPLIAGPNPPGNLSKMISGIKRKRYLSINKGKARRSMVMSEDVGRLIATLPNKPSGTYNLTDGQHPSFRELERLICDQLEVSMPLALPSWLGKTLGWMGDVFSPFPVNSDMISKMSENLTFNDDLAREKLNWSPKAVLKSFKIR